MNSSVPLVMVRFIKIGKRATDSGAFASYINKTRICVSCALWKRGKKRERRRKGKKRERKRKREKEKEREERGREEKKKRNL
jgi:hypothetical protein